MNPAPYNFPRLSSSIVYQDAAKAIDWLCEAFGFELRLKVEGEPGQILHSELTYGEGVIMVSPEKHKTPNHAWQAHIRSPKSLGGMSTQSIMMYVDDVDAHCAKARASGATIVEEPSTHDYGEDYWSDRSYGAVDLEGHVWWISQRLRGPVRK